VRGLSAGFGRRRFVAHSTDRRICEHGKRMSQLFADGAIHASHAPAGSFYMRFRQRFTAQYKNDHYVTSAISQFSAFRAVHHRLPSRWFRACGRRPLRPPSTQPEAPRPHQTTSGTSGSVPQAGREVFALKKKPRRVSRGGAKLFWVSTPAR
jgi:hypothetical protein